MRRAVRRIPARIGRVDQHLIRQRPVHVAVAEVARLLEANGNVALAALCVAGRDLVECQRAPRLLWEALDVLDARRQMRLRVGLPAARDAVAIVVRVDLMRRDGRAPRGLQHIVDAVVRVRVA